MLINAGSYPVFIIPDKYNNKAKSNESVQGFCVNDTTTAGFASQGWKCNYAQALFSNSNYSGLTPKTTTYSRGNPSWSNDASKEPTNMSGGSENPLSPENYRQQFKWGNPRDTKWTDGGKATEKGYRYEGE